MVTLQERFGIRRSEMPCLLLLADVDATEGTIYSSTPLCFNLTLIMRRALTEVFEICKKAVAERPCTVSGAQAESDPKALRRLVEWRTETLVGYSQN